jgi:hypothetical protein
MKYEKSENCVFTNQMITNSFFVDKISSSLEINPFRALKYGAYNNHSDDKNNN